MTLLARALKTTPEPVPQKALLGELCSEFMAGRIHRVWVGGLYSAKSEASIEDKAPHGAHKTPPYYAPVKFSGFWFRGLGAKVR